MPVRLERGAEKIAIVLHGRLERLPMVMASARTIARTGRMVHVLTSSCQADVAAELAADGVRVHLLGTAGDPPTGVFGKALFWRAFRRNAWALLDGTLDVDLLWIASAEAALCLGRRLQRRPYVLQVRELYDTRPLVLKLIRKYARHARLVVVPERNRAAILRSWLRLHVTPTVIPNKIELTEDDVSSLRSASVPEAMKRLRQASRRLVLYQGHIEAARSIAPVAAAVSELGPEWGLALMGVDHGPLQGILSRYPRTVSLGYIPAPRHLAVTAQADIGVLAYGFESLNYAFCAPNKLWEHAAFSVPVLAQDLPGLVDLVELHSAGRIAAFEDVENVRLALQNIDREYERHSDGARKLYASIDLTELLDSAIRRASVPHGPSRTASP